MLRFRRAILVGCIPIFAVLAAGIPGLRFNANYSAYFDPMDPLLIVHDRLTSRYAQFDSAILMLESLRGDMLEPAHYQAMERIATAAARLPFAVRVNAVSELDLADKPPADEALNAWDTLVPSRELILAHDYVRRLLLSDDLRFAAVNVMFRLPTGDAQALLDVMGHFRTLVESEIAALPIAAHFTGTLALNEAYIRVVRHDLSVFLPVLTGVFLVCLYLLFRSVRIFLCILFNAALAVIGAFGIAGWLEFELAAINAFVPVIIASISIAGAVHITTSYLRNRSVGQADSESLENSLSFNFLPLTLTCLTTALGFLGLLFSPSPPVRTVGYVVAFGIGLSYLSTLTLLPILLSGSHKGLDLSRAFYITRIAGWVGRHSKIITAVFTGTAVLALVWVQDNRINDNVFDYFPSSHEFRRDTEIAGKVS